MLDFGISDFRFPDEEELDDYEAQLRSHADQGDQAASPAGGARGGSRLQTEIRPPMPYELQVAADNNREVANLAGSSGGAGAGSQRTEQPADRQNTQTTPASVPSGATENGQAPVKPLYLYS